MSIVLGIVAWAWQGIGGPRLPAPDVAMARDLRPPPARGRLLVILLDGARVQDVFGPHMPFLSGLRDRAAWGISRVLSVPLSIAGQRAILAGELAGPLSLIEDFEPSPFDGPSLVQRVADRGGRVALLDRFLYEQFPGYADPAAPVRRPYAFAEYLPDLRARFRRSAEYLEGVEWRLAVLPAYAIDYLGHLETPASPRYPGLLSEVDDRVGGILRGLEPQDSVLVTAEHGMDSGGFHVEPDPDVIRTPFLLIGPRVSEGGPTEIAQVDLAPTLSLLQGVSPAYPGPGIPALDLVDLPAPYEARLLEVFAVRFGLEAGASIEEIRAARDRRVSSRLPAAHGWTMALLTLVVAAVVGLGAVGSRGPAAGMALGAVTVLTLLAQRTGLLPALLDGIVFSANWLRSNPGLGLVLLAAPPVLVATLVRPRLVADRRGEIVALSAFHVVFLAAFLGPAPVHPLSWILVTLPLLAVAGGGGRPWLALFALAWAGLLMRRLAFWNASGSLELDRGVLAAGLLAGAVLATLVAQRIGWPARRTDGRNGDGRRGRDSPGAASPALPPSGEGRPLFEDAACGVGLLLAALVPCVAEPRPASAILLLAGAALLAAWWLRPGLPPVWLALWATVYLVGTSGRFETLAYAFTGFAFLAIWRLSQETSPVEAGIGLAYGIWLLYLWPGNAFDLRLVELKDAAILGGATAPAIEWTAGLIATRYLAPVLVLLLGASGTSGSGLSPGLLVASGPVLAGLGLLGVELTLGAEETLPWHRIDGIVVLGGWLTATLSAGIVAAGLRRSRRRISPAAAHPDTGARSGPADLEGRTEDDGC